MNYRVFITEVEQTKDAYGVISYKPESKLYDYKYFDSYNSAEAFAINAVLKLNQTNNARRFSYRIENYVF